MTQSETETQPNEKPEQNEKLAQIFAKINMSDLPAMSDHVRELISLTHSSQSAAYELAKVILKDYSLTNKILRVVNSAYYSLGRPVSSISKAVTILGFDAVRDLATAIALFEDFVKTGVEKEGISKLLTQSFLSAIQARIICLKKHLKVLPEEAFICTLLHNLGKIIVQIYLPDLYREIETRVAAGESEEAASRAVLGDLTLPQIGEEIAKFWNLSEKIVAAMQPRPPAPRGPYDSDAFLQNLAVFSNALTETICSGADLTPLLARYDKIIAVEPLEAVEFLSQSVESSEDISDIIRYGLSKLKMRSRLQVAEKVAKGEPVPRMHMESHPPPVSSSREYEGPEEVLDELPSHADKSVDDFIREITETLMGSFNLNDFYVSLLEGLYRGVGFDRVILGILNIQADTVSVVGRYGLGDIDPANVRKFEQPLNSSGFAITRALTQGKDLAIPPNASGAFPENLKYLVKNRTVYLFPIVLDKKPIGIIYADRKVGRPPLDAGRLKSTRLFRDFAIMAIRKVQKKG